MPIFLSFFLMCVFQWFLISLSVLPGRWDAILDHLSIINVISDATERSDGKNN
uniref:Uncharacterized protein n=1 Tax=Rhizophora mucronata TaxID=61149 RepID=A0A2P2NNI6_RHIMU